MNYLKSNFIFILSFSFLSLSCATSTFKVLNQSENTAEFMVSPDRILLECEKIETDDRGIIYGFMIHVLDEEKTSFILAQSYTVGKEDCDLRIKKISNILKSGSEIYLAGFGDYSTPRDAGTHSYLFPKHGSFKHNGRSLQFMAIKNEFNHCWGGFTGEKLPCPDFPFPKYKK